MMFEITYDDTLFNEFTENNHIYRGSQYVFTFDNRFLVYYYKRCDKYIYIALDSKTGLGSEFVNTSYKYKKSEYETLIPKILNSIKYTGELRYLAVSNLELSKNETVNDED